jgi:hypothetical protein
MKNLTGEIAMKTLVIVIVCGVSSLITAGAAGAAPPAWCQGASADTPDLAKLSSTDVRAVLKTFVSAACAPTPEVEAHRGEIEAARQAWSKRLGMAESDWSDVVPYLATRSDYLIRAEPSTDVLATATPMDQYAIIMKVSDLPPEAYSKIDTMYAADMFETNLTQLGRFAFLITSCFDTDRAPALDSDGMLGTEVRWGICQADFERFDLAKFLDEVRADTAHDGAIKMKLRVAAFDLPKRMKDHAADVQQMLERDEGNKKLFEVAANARSEWSSGIGKNTKLLELVLAMDSARLAQSRKQLEGCAEKTAAALADAVATVPAKAFAGMHDDRDNPRAGFATSAGLVLVRSPAVNLAAIAFVQCTPDTGTSELLKDSLANGPGFRGPRNAALGAIKGAKIVYDKMNARLRYPEPRPYGRAYPDGNVAVSSAGGVVKSIKRDGELLTVDLEKTLVKHEECLASHSTGRIERVRDDGTVIYHRVCDRSGTVVRDHTWTDYKVSTRYASWLKPGVQFSSVDHDVIAIWPSKTAKAPSMVLGGLVK